MKEKIQIKSLVLGVLLGAVVVFSVAAAATGGTGTWEYRFLDNHQILEEGKHPGPSFDNIELVLNGAAKEGWGAVSYTADSERRLSVLLRRVKR